MAKYEYVDKKGALQTVEADTPETAIANATDRADTSGVSIASSSAGQSSEEPTIGEALDYSGYSAPEPDSAYEAYEDVDEEKIRREVLGRYQGQLDATKGAYSTLLGETKQMGLGRLGEGTAQQARGGLLGSDFGQAQTDKTRDYNLGQEKGVLESQATAIANIMAQANADASKEIASRRTAKQYGYESLKTFKAEEAERRSANLKKLASSFIRSSIDPQTLGTQLKEIAKTYKVSEADIINEYLNTKYEEDQAVAEANKPFDLSEGQARYAYDPETGEYKLVASRAKTYAPTSGGTGDGSGVGVSPEAQNIIDLINKSGGTVDDYIKGTSIESQKLRNEVFQGLANQGGVTEKSTNLFKEAKAVIDDMINKSDYKKFGYSAKLGGQFTTGFGDMVARAQTVNAILARDNLGLLKGAMSDKDLAFIQAMSAGVPDGTISEAYAKERMESIQLKLAEKVNQYQPVNMSTQPQSTQPQTMELNGQILRLQPDGTYE